MNGSRLSINKKAAVLAVLVLVLLAGAAGAALAEDLRNISSSIRLVETTIRQSAGAQKPGVTATALTSEQLMQWILQRQGPVQIEGRDAFAMGAAAPRRTPLQALQSLSTMKPQTDAQGKVVVHPLQSVTGR
jgi:hypothetical protein